MYSYVACFSFPTADSSYRTITKQKVNLQKKVSRDFSLLSVATRIALRSSKAEALDTEKNSDSALNFWIALSLKDPIGLKTI